MNRNTTQLVAKGRNCVHIEKGGDWLIVYKDGRVEIDVNGRAIAYGPDGRLAGFMWGVNRRSAIDAAHESDVTIILQN